MKKQWKRLIIAALSSSSVFAATWLWYTSTNDHSHSRGNEKPLAYVGKVVEDIQRRPASRLLWQLVNTGEALYNGEAIRTSERGEVRIQFVGSDRYLDLEPESLIVIKQSEGEIALDLMEGSLFVNAKVGAAEGGPGLVLNSAQGKVDLSQASASLSKGRGNAVDVQVFDGKASIQTKDGQEKELSTRTEVKILTPTPQKPIAMDAEALQPISFQWRGFPENTKASLWAGPNRKQLRQVAAASLNQAQLLAPLAFGSHYWKLIATTPEGKFVSESPIYKTEIVPRYAPTVAFPTADLDYTVASVPTELTYRWEKGEEAKQMTLEVWKDEALTDPLLTQSFTDQDTYTLRGLQAGTYFWRMSAYYPDTDKPVLGKVQKFNVLYNQPALAQVAPTVAPIIPVQVQFTVPEAQSTQFYVKDPALGLSWKSEAPEKVSSWRLKVTNEGQDFANAQAIEVRDTKFTAPVTKPGRYIASIEALDKNGQSLGMTSSQVLTVAPLPLLQAPQFLPLDGQLQASSDGRSQLEWAPLEGAKEYWLTIRKEGKELKRSKYSTTNTSLKNLLPGEYEVQLSAVDSYGRESATAPARTLLVPDKSNVRAPTLKKIKVN